MLAGIPLSTWLSGTDAYSLKVIISATGAPEKEIPPFMRVQTEKLCWRKAVFPPAGAL